MPALRAALEASWDAKTAYLGAYQKDNPALGNCYPTSRVVQFFFPKIEIVEGQVWTGKGMEKHFWNLLEVDDLQYHIDFTWQQFPHGSMVKSYKIRNRETLGDGQEATDRVTLLHQRVKDFLALATS